MIILVPEFRRPILEPPDRNPLPFRPRPTPGGALAERFDIIGTAHFTTRSVKEAILAASSGSYSSVALELDRQRFAELGDVSFAVPPVLKPVAGGEFVAASDAFGNRNGDVWLIDMSMDEIRSRISRRLTREEMLAWDSVSRKLAPYEYEGIRQWEAGREEQAMSYLDLTTQAMRAYSPTLYHVLIEERNLMMAARLIDVKSEGRTLVLVGKAHVDGIRRLLAEPWSIRDGMRSNGLNYSPPTRVRRVRVN